MDKYEFNIKVEQIKKMASKSDFETAMRIADTIDWKRVRNANLLSMIAQVYEKNEEYGEAKDILLLAFERAPIGKRLLYKLGELALKEGNISEAEDYYREFCDLAPEDPRQYLLRYLILKEKQAPIDQLTHTLEQYTSTELEEKWLYALAELYQKSGREEECVQICDKIMLMFGLGKYVDKAMELKVQYAPLTNYQMDLVENRDKYEAKLRAVEQEFGG
ncbi:MAG: tetratricopeptide repeat protein, partial [Hungatella sp.]